MAGNLKLVLETNPHVYINDRPYNRSCGFDFVGLRFLFAAAIQIHRNWLGYISPYYLVIFLDRIGRRIEY